MLIDQLLFYLLAWLVFPALRATGPVAQVLGYMGLSVREVSEETLYRNYWIIKVICFIASNAVVYTLNVLFVFRGGRHRRVVEIGMFFAFSLLQFVFIWLGAVLIATFKWEVFYANVTMLLTAMLVNYVVRKKVVFKG